MACVDQEVAEPQGLEPPPPLPFPLLGQFNSFLNLHCKIAKKYASNSPGKLKNYDHLTS